LRKRGTRARARAGSGSHRRPLFFDTARLRNGPELYDKAAELFKKSIELNPADASEACNYLGFMWADRNTHLDEAEDYIKRALGADPRTGAYLDSLGWLHYRRGKYEAGSRAAQRRAGASRADDPTVFEHIGDTYGC
jgi:tetratricopeptide (TPR) repeat protein